TTPQVLNFRLTARDNRNGGGGVCSDEMVLNVVGTSAFVVTSQSLPSNWTANGTNTATITWNVANTNIAPINCTAVDILFSADGGLTYPYTLLSNTPNDGTQDIVIPAVATTKGRVMVRARNNVFFNINSFNITVAVNSCVAEGATISPTTNVVAAAGSASLNLVLSPQYATIFSANGTITVTDPSSNLTVADGAGACTQYSNYFNYDTYIFTVSVSGNYTFQRTGSGSIFNFYSNSFNPLSPCTNFLKSNYTVGVGTAATVTINLTAGTTYVLVEGVYGPDASTPASNLPFSYSFAVTATPAGGAVYNGSGIYNNPGAGFSYSYVIVDNATNTIKAISSSANLSNATTYPNGTSYTVYGISYNSSNATTLNSYIGGSFSALTSAIIANPSTFCANLSKNTVAVNVASTVPVTFLGLKARKLDKKVLLEWGTASEVNSDYFAVQRSADGTSFTSEVARLTAAGNSNTTKNYSTTDVQPLSNWNYYRIKQVDKDGRTTYSNIAAINFEKAAALIIVYPNPAKEKLTIEYTSTKTGNVQMQVMDSKGSYVLANTVNVIAGRNTHAFNIAALSKGVYVLKCSDADGNVNFVKFIKE
ncbi:MAG: T9SS type A sorting domain-containing protein, partial [Chitinophagaceae bacterium]|nr:T9SS type A sorting domain-containing protein [Chitinophagaceae bacterium]